MVPNDRELLGLYKERDEVEQILGRVLGYPPYYPIVTQVDDGRVCVGEHTPPTLAEEAANRIRNLEKQVSLLSGEWVDERQPDPSES